MIKHFVQNGMLLDHSKSIKDSINCSNCKIDRKVYLSPELFNLDEPFIKASKNRKTKKKKRKYPFDDQEALAIEYHNSIFSWIQNKLLDLKQNISAVEMNIDKSLTSNIKSADDTTAVQDIKRECSFCDNIMNSDSASLLKIPSCLPTSVQLKIHLKLNLLFRNNQTMSCFVQHNDGIYFLPPQTNLLMSDVKHLNPLISDCVESGKYDVIVIDPPWENKSVKRGCKYTWLEYKDIANMPLNDLANEHCLFLVWVTNKLKTCDFVENTLFPSVGASKIANWYWVKLTTSYEPIYPFDSLHKKPYETVMLGCNCLKYGHECCHMDIPKQLMISSILCSIHSCKPPLHYVLQRFLPDKFDNMRRLEMFARNLFPGWTSWGNEVLKHQDIQYFQVV